MVIYVEEARERDISCHLGRLRRMAGDRIVVQCFPPDFRPAWKAEEAAESETRAIKQGIRKLGLFAPPPGPETFRDPEIKRSNAAWVKRKRRM